MVKPLRLFEWSGLAVGLWLASANAYAEQTEAYLPTVGVSPLRFQSFSAGGQTEGLPPLLLWRGPATNATALDTTASANSSAGTRNQPALPATAALASPAITAPADTNLASLPPMNEPVPVGSTLTDMQSVLKWLLPASGNVPDGSRLFPVFAPATPPRSSSAVYQSR